MALNYHTVTFKAAFGTSKQLPASAGPEVSFAGRSNVGKSSLLNKLFGRKGLAKVSQTPGKTATINFYDVDGYSFVDLPGYGYAKASKSELERWSELMDGYFGQERQFALVCVLVDIRHDASPLDQQMLDYLRERQLPFAVVLTKADKLSKQQTARQKAALRKQFALDEGTPCLTISSSSGQGIDELRSLIAARLRLRNAHE